MSLKNDRMYGSEDICVKLQKDETEKLIPNIEQHHQPMFKQISSTKSMKSGIHLFNRQEKIQEGSEQLSKNFGDKYNESVISFEEF